MDVFTLPNMLMDAGWVLLLVGMGLKRRPAIAVLLLSLGLFAVGARKDYVRQRERDSLLQRDIKDADAMEQQWIEFDSEMRRRQTEEFLVQTRRNARGGEKH